MCTKIVKLYKQSMCNDIVIFIHIYTNKNILM